MAIFKNFSKKNQTQAEIVVKNLTSEFISKKVDPEIAKSIFYSLILDAMNVSEKMLLLDESVKTKIPEIFNSLSKSKTVRELSDASLTIQMIADATKPNQNYLCTLF